MRISEASSQSGLSIDTIRFYEKTGVSPKIMRGDDGKRYFTPKDIDWLTLLYWLRETGMPMKTMQQFAKLYKIGDCTIAEREKILLAHSKVLKERRSNLDHCQKILNYKLKMYRKMKKG